MAAVAPEGPVYQAGTLSGNPLAMAAGEAALARLAGSEVYETLEKRAGRLADGLTSAIAESAAAGRASVRRVGSLLTLFWTPEPPLNYDGAKAGDAEAFARVFHRMLARGIHLPPSPYEAWFLTLAHGDPEIDATVRAAAEALEGTGP